MHRNPLTRRRWRSYEDLEDQHVRIMDRAPSTSTSQTPSQAVVTPSTSIDQPVAPPTFTPSFTTANPKVTILSLPRELRLQIFSLAIVSLPQSSRIKWPCRTIAHVSVASHTPSPTVSKRPKTSNSSSATTTTDKAPAQRTSTLQSLLLTSRLINTDATAALTTSTLIALPQTYLYPPTLLSILSSLPCHPRLQILSLHLAASFRGHSPAVQWDAETRAEQKDLYGPSLDGLVTVLSRVLELCPGLRELYLALGVTYERHWTFVEAASEGVRRGLKILEEGKGYAVRKAVCKIALHDPSGGRFQGSETLGEVIDSVREEGGGVPENVEVRA